MVRRPFQMNSPRTSPAILPLLAQQLGHVLDCLPPIGNATAGNIGNMPIPELLLHCPGRVVSIEIPVDQGSQPEITKSEFDLCLECFPSEAVSMTCGGNPNTSTCGSARHCSSGSIWSRVDLDQLPRTAGISRAKLTTLPAAAIAEPIQIAVSIPPAGDMERQMATIAAPSD